MILRFVTCSRKSNKIIRMLSISNIFLLKIIYIYINVHLYRCIVDRYLPFRRLEFKLVIVTCTDTPNLRLFTNIFGFFFQHSLVLKHLFAYFLRFFSLLLIDLFLYGLLACVAINNSFFFVIYLLELDQKSRTIAHYFTCQSD